MKSKPTKPIPPTPWAYRREANALAQSFVRIDPCGWCGYPTVRGYCCMRCGYTGGPLDEWAEVVADRQAAATSENQ